MGGGAPVPDFENRYNQNPEIQEHGVDPLLGTTLDGRFEVLSLLGAGGMGRVYKARHTLTGAMVALKVLHPALVNEAESLKRFHNEAAALSKLNNPHVVKVLSFGIADGRQPYLAMEFVEGIPLTQRIGEGNSEGNSSMLGLIGLFRQCCDGLMVAHENGVIHRDIKPGNILLSRLHDGSEWVKIADFGLAKVLSTTGGGVQALTSTGQVFGSPAYMSPEQCNGQPVDQRTDIYSLGCVMYECVAGKPPFEGDSAYAVLLQHLNAEPAPLPQLRGSEFERVENIILHTLEKDPDKRYQTVADLARDLQIVVQNSSGELQAGTGMDFKSKIRKPALLTRVRLTGLLVGAAAALAGLLLAASLLTNHSPRVDETPPQSDFARLEQAIHDMKACEAKAAKSDFGKPEFDAAYVETIEIGRPAYQLAKKSKRYEDAGWINSQVGYAYTVIRPVGETKEQYSRRFINAVRCFESAIKDYNRAGDTIEIQLARSDTENKLASQYIVSNRFADAAKVLPDVVACGIQRGKVVEVMAAEALIGWCELQDGKLDKAESAYRGGLQRHQASISPDDVERHWEHVCKLGLASVAARRGQDEHAYKLFHDEVQVPDPEAKELGRIGVFKAVALDTANKLDQKGKREMAQTLREDAAKLKDG
jgi:serine/threonine protein kinase